MEGVRLSLAQKGHNGDMVRLRVVDGQGVRVRDVLEDCGIKDNAVYIGYYGIDIKLTGEEESPISRGVPIKKL